MGIDSHLSTCVGTQSPKYLEMAQRHISLSDDDEDDVDYSNLFKGLDRSKIDKIIELIDALNEKVDF
jgi:hypothetical protein